MMCGMPISLDPDSILAEARDKTGLADFGDESYHEALVRMLRSLDQEARLNAAGRAMQRQRTVDILINRARTEEFFRRHPEIADEQIGAPVVICGLPRTGTTLLHRVIANDPGFDAVLWYECRFPAPLPGWRPDAADARIAIAEQEVAATLAAMPELAAIHPFDARGPDEEIMLLEQSFFSRTPESYANLPSFAEWLDRQDQLPGYVYLHRLLQFLQWQHRRQGRARPRWVLKAPHHLSFMPLLFRMFPDATVIQTHRDPLQSIPSICSMCFWLWKLGSDDPDPKVTGRHWNAKWADALQRCLDYRDAGHEDRFIDIWYLDSLRDPIGVVRRIYGAIGRELTPIAEDKMRRWTGDNAREKRAPHEYTLEQFGLSEASIARDYRAYRERYIAGRT
jgi:hypothetical protein